MQIAFSTFLSLFKVNIRNYTIKVKYNYLKIFIDFNISSLSVTQNSVVGRRAPQPIEVVQIWERILHYIPNLFGR